MPHSKQKQHNFNSPILGSILALLLLSSSALLWAKQPLLIYAFRNFKSNLPERMMLVGEIKNKTKELIPSKQQALEEYDVRLDRVTVKLFDRKGLKVGQKLYIIEKNPYHRHFRDGFVVGELRILSIFYSPFYGWTLSGNGILLRIRKGHFVARSLNTESLERAYAIKRQGDHYWEQGEQEQAVVNYREALSADISLAEAHAALGRFYFQEAINHKLLQPLQALAAYERAWNYHENFRYDAEQMSFYRDYIRALDYAYKKQLNSGEVIHEGRRFTSNSKKVKKKVDSILSSNFHKNRKNILLGYLERIITIGNTANKKKRKSKSIQEEFNLDIMIALARTHYYRMLHNEKQANTLQRKQYDFDKAQADKYLKVLLKQEKRNGELFRVAILFYIHRYKELNTQDASQQKLRSQLKQIILEKLAPYYNLYMNPRLEKKDPQIQKILQKLR